MLRKLGQSLWSITYMPKSVASTRELSKIMTVLKWENMKFQFKKSDGICSDTIHTFFFGGGGEKDNCDNPVSNKR